MLKTTTVGSYPRKDKPKDTQISKSIFYTASLNPVILRKNISNNKFLNYKHHLTIFAFNTSNICFNNCKSNNKFVARILPLWQ